MEPIAGSLFELRPSGQFSAVFVLVKPIVAKFDPTPAGILVVIFEDAVIRTDAPLPRRAGMPSDLPSVPSGSIGSRCVALDRDYLAV